MIESINNERVKYYAKLQDKKYRKSEKLFIASGKHLVEEALKKDLVKEILLLEGEENIYGNVTYVTSSILKKISGLETNPKVLAICHIRDNDEIRGNVIILDNIKDPGNLGTIIRSAVAFNYETIILSDNSVDIYNPKVVRSSEGMLFNINIINGSLNDKISTLKSLGYKIYGTNVNDGKKPSKCPNKHALIIGSEASGMSDKTRVLVDENLYIEMNSLCESLNAGVSASILMYVLGGKK